MNEKRLISVIVPVYNAEKTLRRCVDSLLDQNFPDAEIILINDGSKDASDELCRGYQAADARIVYLKKENGGVSSARNAGLDLATGTYITFVDSDDYVEPDYFQTILELIEQSNPDWIQFSNTLLRGEARTVRQRASVSFSEQSDCLDEISSMICHKSINGPCDKVYKKSILDRMQLSFLTSIEIGEDWAFNLAYSCSVQTFVGSDRPLYFVCEDRADSLSRKPRADLDEQLHKAIRYAENRIENSSLSGTFKAQLKDAVSFYELSMVYTKAKNLQREGVGVLQRYQTIRALCKAENRKNRSYPNTMFCRLVTMPVRLHLAPAIDYIARTKMR